MLDVFHSDAKQQRGIGRGDEVCCFAFTLGADLHGPAGLSQLSSPRPASTSRGAGAVRRRSPRPGADPGPRPGRPADPPARLEQPERGTGVVHEVEQRLGDDAEEDRRGAREDGDEHDLGLRPRRGLAVERARASSSGEPPASAGSAPGAARVRRARRRRAGASRIHIAAITGR